MKACCKKLKLLHCQYNYDTEFRIYDTYISGPPFEKKNPPSSGSAYGLDAGVKPHPPKCDFTIDLIRMPVGVTTCSGNYFDVKEVNSLMLTHMGVCPDRLGTHISPSAHRNWRHNLCWRRILTLAGKALVSLSWPPFAA